MILFTDKPQQTGTGSAGSKAAFVINMDDGGGSSQQTRHRQHQQQAVLQASFCRYNIRIDNERSFFYL